jgi:hypothetical protein
MRDFGWSNLVDSGLVLFVWSILSDCPSHFRDSSIEPGEIASGNSVFANVFSGRYQYSVTLPVFGKGLYARTKPSNPNFGAIIYDPSLREKLEFM